MGIEGKPVAADVAMTKMIALDRQTDYEKVQASIEEDVTTAMAKYSISGIDVSPKDAATKVRDAYRLRHDETITAELLQLKADLDASERAYEATIAASRLAPAPKADLTDSTRELLWFRRLTGRSRASIVAAYETEADPVLQHMVERGDVAELFRATSADDVAAVQRLQNAIADRQAQREDGHAVKALASLREFRTRNMRLAELMRQAGRGEILRIARAPRGA